MKHLLLTCISLLFFPIASQAMTFAQLALGGGYEATALITNKSSFTWKGSFRARQGANELWSGAWSINNQDATGADQANFELGPKQTFKCVFRGDATTRTGYLQIIADTASGSNEANIAVAYFYNYYSGDVLTNSTGSPASAAAVKMLFPVERSASVDTGYAICPYSKAPPFQVKLTLYHQSGAPVDQETIDFKGQFAEFFSQRFPGLPTDFIGYVLVESQFTIALEVLRMETASDGRFLITSTPADTRVP